MDPVSLTNIYGCKFILDAFRSLTSVTKKSHVIKCFAVDP